MKKKEYEEKRVDIEKEIHTINDMQYKIKTKLGGKVFLLFRSKLIAGVIKKQQIMGIINLMDKFGFKELLIADDEEGLIVTIY